MTPSAQAAQDTRELTTFPAVFRDEEDVSVNQVISSLFSKVKSRFAPAAAQEVPSSAAQDVTRLARAAQADSNGLADKGVPGPGPPREKGEASSQDGYHVPDATPQPPGKISASASIQRTDSSTTQATSQGRKDGRPGLMPKRSNVSAPAPPLVSVTAVSRMRTREGESPVSIEPRNRLPGHHVRNTSLSSFQRQRRGSLSALSMTPSTSSLSAFAVEQLDHTAVPGFPIADDARSLRTVASGRPADGVSKIIRRLRGEGLSKQYWMADEACKECYDCKSVFTTWRRKHHCRICGQIFCGRCAPNIIKGMRFGQDGMVRVCNLCLQIMDGVDDDEDKRSVASTGTYNLAVPAPIMNWQDGVELGQNRSPFGASELFSRGHDQLNASSRGAWHHPRQAAEFSPPDTPSEGDTSEMDFGRQLGHGRHPLLATGGANRFGSDSAPFRRGIEEEDQDDRSDRKGSARPERAASEVSKGPSGRVGGPKIRSGVKTSSSSVDADGSTVPFPAASKGEDPNQDASALMTVAGKGREANLVSQPFLQRTRLSSHMSTSGLSGVLLGDPEDGYGVWRSRSDSLVALPDILQGASLRYFKTMLRQVLDRESTPRAGEWTDVLERLLLKTSANVSPNIRRGDAMDVGKYVKVKRIPGGAIRQSEYVDGVVITQNLAHKQMSRHMISPRVMLLTFPLDYHRVENQFMSLEPLLAQERNYLKHLTKRVIDMRPHLVLVGPSVSKLALDFLLEAKVAVSRGVKATAIQEVARATQGDIIASMDKMALEPRLGRCTEFRVQTYEHPLLPGYRKTYMRFEGCNAELGCTLVLRGADMETLAKIKGITRFMAGVATNLKWERCAYRDHFEISPPDEPGWCPDLEAEDAASWLQLWARAGATSKTKSGSDSKSSGSSQDEVDRRTTEIARSILPYVETAISTSSAVKYPPPSPLAKMGRLDYRLRRLRRERDDAEAAQILVAERRTPQVNATAMPSPVPAVLDGDVSVGTNGLLVPPAALVGPVTPLPGPIDGASDAGDTPVETSPKNGGSGNVALNDPQDVKQDSDIAHVEHAHAEQLKIWSWYTSRYPPKLRPEDYQYIVYLKSVHRKEQEKACAGPNTVTTKFYSSDDCTLGQFIEKTTASAGQPCANRACPQPMLQHSQLLVHGETRLQIAMEAYSCPIPGNEDHIITWSFCEVCQLATPLTPLSEETWKMSWAKYLESGFYHARSGKARACRHDLYRDHVRLFAHRSLVVRIHNQPISVLDVVRPSLRLQIRQELRVGLKNDEYTTILAKIGAFFDSMSVRIRTYDPTDVQPDLLEKLKKGLDSLLARAGDQRAAIVDQLERTYKMTSVSDVLALNSVYMSLQDMVIQLDNDFQELEKRFVPHKREVQGMSAAQFARFLGSVDFVGDNNRSVSGTSVSSISDVDEDSQAGENDDEGSRQSNVSMPEVVISEADSPAAPSFPELQLEGESLDAAVLPMGAADVSETTSLSNDATPLAEHPPQRFFEDADNPEAATDSPDSDSTISALPRSKERETLTRPPANALSSPECDKPKAAMPFVSRLPRRSKQNPTVADLISRFQARDQLNRQPDHAKEETTADLAGPTRPRLTRRGKTEGYQHTRQHGFRSLALSDDDRSYAANASRVTLQPFAQQGPRPAEGSATPSKAASRPSSRTGSRIPVPIDTGLARTKSPMLAPSTSQRGSARNAISKTPLRQTTDPIIRRSQLAPGLRTPGRRHRGTHASSKVSTISRHFEELTAEAEQDRQKRLALARSRRARPVTMTKAKVQVFHDVRDAFHDDDEEDDAASSGSSGADDEEDHAVEHEGAGEGTEETGAETVAADVKQPEAVPAPPAAERPLRSIDDEDAAPTRAKDSLLSHTRRDSSGKAPKRDGLQMALAPYETTAPLLSVPPTPTLIPTKDSSPQERAQLSESEVSTGPNDRTSGIYKTLSRMLKLRSGEMLSLEYPLSAAEHVFADSRIIIREDEPTSIIAFTLASKPYRDQVRLPGQSSRSRKQEHAQFDEKSDQANSSWDIVSMEEVVEQEEAAAKREAGVHLKYDFASGQSSIHCRIFYAEQFAALRAGCGCEESIVESLARCMKWNADGGKSGSAFLKTQDQRFVAKEVSRLEMDALTRFAPSYFDYMRQSLQHSRPTALAKIYGFFKIGYRNALTGGSLRMNVLIMENLFYDRTFSRIYDLKGSMRNRLAVATGRLHEVLLDENLAEMSHRQPLYMRDLSKKILKTALWNDTLFLSNLNVMDYSLVVGVDEERGELAVGVVDYIRTFTWDKKLESWVKDLGGAGRLEPTIVTPKQYKTRFRAAMDRYFVAVPDRWSVASSETVAVEDDAIQSL